MHDVPQSQPLLDDHNSRSSIYEKTTADERRKIDRAIVNRDPPTYRGVFSKFRLAEKGVSFTAFYNYARRLRAAAQNYNMAELVAPAQADLNLTLPRLLGDRLIETLLYNEDASPAQIHRLTLAYSSAVNAAIKAHDARHVFRRQSAPPSDSTVAASLERTVKAPRDAAPDVACRLADSTNTRPAKVDIAGRPLSELSNDELCALADVVFVATDARLNEHPTIVATAVPATDDSMKAHGKPAGGVAPDSPPSEISNPEISNSSSSEIPIPPPREPAPDLACRLANPHSAFRIPTSTFDQSPPDRRIPTSDDLPDADPRREALRQRLRENYKPLTDLDST